MLQRRHIAYDMCRAHGGDHANERDVRLFRNGRNQAVRIPREFELPGGKAILPAPGGRSAGDRAGLKRKRNLLEILATLEPLDEEFPEVDDPLAIDKDIF
jgi:antitoxin VapB